MYILKIPILYLHNHRYLRIETFFSVPNVNTLGQESRSDVSLWYGWENFGNDRRNKPESQEEVETNSF
jgi:hypothetical protein